MKTRIAFLTFVFLICALGAPWPNQVNAADEVSCVKCHTDANVMKSLFKTPKIDLGEGEG